jgi:membrane protein YqaA with SNARE-associated domain
MFTFFISEAFLGILPPEFFIVWSATLSNQWLYLGVLSVLSYFGGLLSYVIGAMITKIPAVDTWLQSKIKSQLEKLKKWGGLLIVVGALLPLPFSISCMAAGIIKFPFKSVMIYGSLRFLRFFVYALIIFNVI